MLDPSGYREDHSKGAMLRFEDSLPKLPVPTLEETSKRYLKSVRPLLNKAEFDYTQKVVSDFTKPGNIGSELQKRLEARRKDPKHRNWLHEWWNHAAYLSYRDPVVPYVSYFYSHRDDRRRRNPAKRAAAITTAVLEFKKQVDNGSLEPEYMKRLPISMEAYQWMFNTCRVPGKTVDHPVKYSYQDHKYIVVVRKSQFFKVMYEIGGQQLTYSELEKQFSRIYRMAQKAPAVGALTVQNRDLWYSAREALLQAHPANAATIEAIQASAFLVCLDDASPITLEERAHQYWHGDGANRWFDKPLEFIINDNGTSGFLGEHSMMDGTPTHRLNDYANMMIFSNKLDLAESNIRSDLAEPTALKFHVNDAVNKGIHRAIADHEALMAQHDLRVQAYQGYGKGLIKKFKCSPDAYVQMTIQLAYHKMYGMNRPTYESAATRRFQQGRTETCRTVSDESVAFCSAMADPEVPPEECVKAFRAAVDAHVKYITDASDGKGVDRHLFGLKNSLKEGEEMPELFKDRAYSYSATWYLSSSQLSSEYFNGYGWSQVIDDGFGIAYMINENRYVSYCQPQP
jgi:carnitine O-acetyltransferase